MILKIDGMEEDEVRDYFRLEQRIHRIKMRKTLFEKMFYAQSMAGKIEFNGLELRFNGFNVEANVLPMIDETIRMDKRIIILEKKHLYITRYLNSLDSEEKEYLIHQYVHLDGICSINEYDRHLVSELKEIEIAIDFLYKDSSIYTASSVNIAVKNNHVIIKKDNLIDDFNQVTQMLGV